MALKKAGRQGFLAVPQYRSDLAASHNNLGNVLIDLRQRPEAEQFRSAAAIQEKLAADFPAVPDHLKALAVGHKQPGNSAERARRSGRRRRFQYRKALAIQDKLVAEFPAVRNIESTWVPVTAISAVWSGTAASRLKAWRGSKKPSAL